MRPLSFISMIFFSVSLIHAGNINLSGTVKTDQGQAIAGAHISLKHFPSLRVITDAAGAFTLTRTSSESFTSDTICAVARGFRTGIIAITSYEKNGIAFTLSKSNPWIPEGALKRNGKMVQIKAKGYDFEMGQPIDTIRGIYFDMPTTDVEQPVHTVKFTYDFWMDTTEVTQGEYDSLMKQVYGNKYVRPAWNASNGIGKKWAAYSIEWGSAALFCNARSKSQGLPDTAYSYTSVIGSIGSICTLQNVKMQLHANAYRLPTEAEWEYACRAGTTTDYYWGKNFESYPRTKEDTIEAGNYAVLDYNSFSLGKDKIIRHENGLDSSYYGVHEVGKKKPNAYGLYDMAGNVAEWCNDWLEYYPWGEIVDATGIVPANPTGYSRVRRGGNWSNSISYLRSSERQFAAGDYEFLFCGFRVAGSGIFTTGIRDAIKKTSGALPQIVVSSGAILCTNAGGKVITLHTLQGKKIEQYRTTDDVFRIAADRLIPGSYIVTIGEHKLSSTIVTVLR